jgi:hypothetical protein
MVRSMAHLVDIWAEAIGIAVAQHIRVISRPGHVHLAGKSLPGACVPVHCCTRATQAFKMCPNTMRGAYAVVTGAYPQKVLLSAIHNV